MTHWDHLTHQPLEFTDLEISLPVKGMTVHAGGWGSGDIMSLRTRLYFTTAQGHRVAIVGTVQEIQELCQKIGQLEVNL